MAIKIARVRVNGQWYDLTLDPATRMWEAVITAPGSSIHQPGGVYNLTLEAVNETGSTVTADGSTFPGLLLPVRDVVRPVLTVVSPGPGTITDNMAPVIVDVTDDDSGADMETFSLAVDGVEVPAEHSPIPGGYRAIWTPTEPHSDGAHVISARVTDYDGNTGETNGTFAVDTTPPRLSIFNRNFIVDTATLEITGRTGDETSPPVTVRVECGEFAGSPDVQEDGSWAQEIPLTFGDNNITVTATDAVGLSTVEELLVMRLVTDRTQEDVDRLKRLEDAGWAKMSESDRAWYMAEPCRGGYNAVDMNRVERACAYLASILQQAPASLRDYCKAVGMAWDKLYDMPYDPDDYYLTVKTDWNEHDEPPPWERARYLSNVVRLSAAMEYDKPELPRVLRWPHYYEVNNIELTLVRLSAAIGPYMEQSERLIDLAALSRIYSGEAMAGEF